MTVAPSLPFPSGRVLADWQRQLAFEKASAIQVGYLVIHRVEALARIVRAGVLDPPLRFLLRALVMTSTDGKARGVAAGEGRSASLAHLERLLGLDASFVQRMLRTLERDGLVVPAESGDSAARPAWRLTPAGLKSLETDTYQQESCERRVFHFLVNPGSQGRDHYVSLTGTDFAPAASDALLRSASGQGMTALDMLHPCVAQPLDWKRQWSFPVEITAIETPGLGTRSKSDGRTEPLPWQRVIVSRLVQVFVVLVRAAERVRAFAARPDGWVLVSKQPFLVLGDAEGQTILPQLFEEPSLESWRAAWVAWGQSRNLSEAELRACDVRREGIHLRIRDGKRLAERLRSSRSDLPAGEAWVVVGEGVMRAAACLEIGEEQG